MKQELLRSLSLFFILLLIICSITPSNFKLMGRPLWPDPKKIINFELDGKGTSQQIMDIYSFSHITHGILFYFLIKYLNLFHGATKGLGVTIILETLWEIFENTPFIINKYRQKKAYKNYKGDSIVNMIGDIIFTIVGYYFAYKSPKLSIIYLVVSEIILTPLKANFLYLSFGSLIKSS